MKKLVSILLILAVCFCLMGIAGTSYVRTLFSAETIAGSATATSDYINLVDDSGAMSIQAVITGAGTIDIDYLMSNDNLVFTKPTGASNIATGLTAGTHFISFRPGQAFYMKVRATETAGNPVDLTLLFSGQKN